MRGRDGEPKLSARATCRDYLKALAQYRSRIWKCARTGMANMTFEEALTSEANPVFPKVREPCAIVCKDRSPPPSFSVPRPRPCATPWQSRLLIVSTGRRRGHPAAGTERTQIQSHFNLASTISAGSACIDRANTSRPPIRFNMPFG